MKIRSRRGQTKTADEINQELLDHLVDSDVPPHLDIELDLNDIDEPAEFEYYEEEWVIQGRQP